MLKSYYKIYHKQRWAFKKKHHRLRRWKLAADISSLVFGTGGIAASIATSGVALIAISSIAIIIQCILR